MTLWLAYPIVGCIHLPSGWFRNNGHYSICDRTFPNLFLPVATGERHYLVGLREQHWFAYHRDSPIPTSFPFTAAFRCRTGGFANNANHDLLAIHACLTHQFNGTDPLVTPHGPGGRAGSGHLPVTPVP